MNHLLEMLFTLIVLLGSLKGTTNPQSFSELTDNVKGKEGDFGIYIKDLKTQQIYEYNSELLVNGASLFKVPVGVATLKAMELGLVKSGDEVTLEGSDFSSGSGVFNTYPAGSKVLLKDVLSQLIYSSDNTAQQMLMRTIPDWVIKGGFDLNKSLTGKSDFYHRDITSAKEFGIYLEELYFGEYLGVSDRDYLVTLMSKTLFDDRVTPYIGDGLVFAHKIGNDPEGAGWHDCGIVLEPPRTAKAVVCVTSRGVIYQEFLEVCRWIGEWERFDQSFLLRHN